MKLCIHRGTHQIGGIAAEISTASTRILIDMGDELSLDPNFVSAPLNIPGVTDGNGHCDAVLFTHYHGDHTGQMLRIRPEIPIYAGALAKDIMRLSAERGGQKNEALCRRIETIQTFSPGKPFLIGDIQITPFCIDHSACDSYLFLIEADGKRLLYSMWDGYRTKPDSTIPEFLSLTGTWAELHTSGHASPDDLRHVIEKADPEIVIPMHTDAPERMQTLCQNRKVILLKDREELLL